MFIRWAPTYSIVKSLLSTTLSSSLRNQNSIRTNLRIYRPAVTQLASRNLHSTPYYRQHAVQEEDLVDEAEYEDEPSLSNSATQSRAVNDNPNGQQSSMGSRVDAAERLGPVTKFHELADRRLVSPVLVNTLTKDMKLETMTEVQSLTINQTLKGVDV